MTNAEAYKIMYTYFEPYGDESEQDEAIKIALKAIAKQIPKKPLMNVIHYPHTSDLTTVQCPTCKRRLRTRRTQAKGDRFCPDCGQAINWEDE